MQTKWSVWLVLSWLECSILCYAYACANLAVKQSNIYFATKSAGEMCMGECEWESRLSAFLIWKIFAALILRYDFYVENLKCKIKREENIRLSNLYFFIIIYRVSQKRPLVLNGQLLLPQKTSETGFVKKWEFSLSSLL